MKTRMMLLGIMLLSLFCAVAVPAWTQTSDTDFQQAVTAYQQSPSDATAEKVIRITAAMEQLPPIPEEARRHFVRGTALFKDAKSPGDYTKVIDEFEQATYIAPWWPDARYNWALAWEAAGDYDKAMGNLKLYLLFKLPEADTRAAQDKIYVLEAKQEKAKDKVAATKDLFRAFGITGEPGPPKHIQRGSVSEYEVRAAIERGADVNAKAFTGWPILVHAMVSCQANIVQLLLEHGADARDGQALIAEIDYCEDTDIAKMLIDKGADVNAKRISDGQTALIDAAEVADVDVVRLLIDHGADVNARNDRGQTPLRGLLEEGGNGFWNDNRKARFERDKPEVIRLLRQAGAVE